MKKISNFETYETASGLTDTERCDINGWVKKYEKYFNVYNSKSVNECISNLAEDACNKLGVKNKREVEKYIRKMYDLSEGLSIVMAPNPMIQSNVIDQVQHLQY